MGVADALLRRVYESPEKDEPRAVYADHLIAEGRDLGEFIQLQLARSRGRRTKAKEKRVFNPLSWPDHPVGELLGAVTYEATDRGFPAVFSPALPVNEDALGEEVERWQTGISHPGWATVCEVRAFGVDAPVLGDLLVNARMPLLTRVGTVGRRVFSRIANTSLNVEHLAVRATGNEPFAVIQGLPRLRSLEWRRSDGHETLAGVMEMIGGTRALERISELDVCGHVVERPLSDVVDAFERLPSDVDRLVVRGEDFDRTEVRRGGEAVVKVTAHTVDELAEDLLTFDPTRISELTVVFVKRGYFTKRNRPTLAEKIRRATAHFPDCTLEVG